jgi:hypothetical protein
MGQRDQLVRALGGLDRGDPRDGRDVALGSVSRGHAGGGGGRHPDHRAGTGEAVGWHLGAHVDHAGPAGRVQVRELSPLHHGQW